MIKYCGAAVVSRSSWQPAGGHRCWKFAGHDLAHSEYPYLEQLAKDSDALSKKIQRDATMTTGAAWKSDDAGPNRARRWIFLEDEAVLARKGIRLSTYKPLIRAKLLDKAATYEDCMGVARKLTWDVYGMGGAPTPPADIRHYLEEHFGPIVVGSTVCLICRDGITFDLFAMAKRGRAFVETAHANPRSHSAENVGFAHRDCNIAQGDRSLSDFYDWMETILNRVRVTN